MAEWRTKTLGDLTSLIVKGIAPSYVDEENEFTIRVLNQKCNRNFEITYTESRLHSLLKKKIAEDRIIRNGDVLINSTGTGTAGRVAQIWNVPCKTTIDGHMILMRPTEEIDARYYGYAIRMHQAEIESFAEGSTGQTEINRSRLCNNIEISYPVDKIEQLKVVKLLFDLDERIKTNNQINDNLSA
jgi:type I restriction enzyme S subunit